jgi:ribose transport system substrate-binding protein
VLPVYTGPLLQKLQIPTEAFKLKLFSDLIDAQDRWSSNLGGDINAIEPVIEKAVQAGIPVITFDSDAPNSKRIAYIGTDNYFLSSTSQVLKQLVPL